MYQLAWDDLIHHYIGGSDADSDLELGITVTNKVPQILKCPADRVRLSISWAGLEGFVRRRSYSMNFAGGMDLRAGDRLPTPRNGVGIYFSKTTEARSFGNRQAYKVSAVQDNAGTILLAELANGENICGNDWPSFCAGPVPPGNGFRRYTPMANVSKLRPQLTATERPHMVCIPAGLIISFTTTMFKLLKPPILLAGARRHHRWACGR